MLLSCIVDRAVGSRKDVRLFDLHVARKRDSEANPVALDLEVRDARERSGERLAPLVELRPVRSSAAHRNLERQFAAFGHADLVGAGEPVRLRPDRNGARRIRRRLQPEEDGIVLLVNIIHQPGDREPGRHRVLQVADRPTLGKLPLHFHRQAGIARIEPVAVPARLGVHDDRKLDLAARRGGPLGDQLRIDSTCVPQGGCEQECEENQQPVEHGSAL